MYHTLVCLFLSGSPTGSDFDQCVAHIMADELKERLVALEEATGAVSCELGAPTCALHNLYPLSEGMRRQLTDNQLATVVCMALPEGRALDTQQRGLRSPGAETKVRGVTEGTTSGVESEGGRSSCNQWEPFKLELTRADYEGQCKPLFDRGLTPVSRLLTYLDLTVDEIDEVVMVGGMTRTPRVRELLKSHLGVKRLNVEIDPDVVVAYGAATIAH